MNRIRICMALLLIALGSPVYAGNFEDGEAALGKGDYVTAAREYRKAAEQGFAKAQYNLGVMYRKGEGVPQSYVQAHMWFNLAATQGMEGAKETRDSIAKKMTSAQIAEAQELAHKWFKEHSK